MSRCHSLYWLALIFCVIIGVCYAGVALARSNDTQTGGAAQISRPAAAGSEVTSDVGIGLTSPLPADNLILNPWFRTGNKPSLAGWTAYCEAEGGWVASQKTGNPTPDAIEGTSARISTGRGAQRTGWSVDPGVGAYLYQVVPADSRKKTLKFDMYWVTHTVDPVIVTVYGGSTAQGPWEAVWEPFRQVVAKSVLPATGRGQDLWVYYSDSTDIVTTTLAGGHPYYKVEIYASLPDQQGGLKLSGIYFAVE